MSWSDRLAGRDWRRAAAVAGALVWLGLAGCGFEPLYGREDDGTAVTDDLASIRIAPIRDRTGQQLHNLLRDRLNPLGQPADPAYRLTLEVTERKRGLGVRRDATASRANLTMTVRFELRDAANQNVLFRGRTVSTNSYDILILEQQLSTITSELDARERGLQEISHNIKLRLAAYFRGQRT